MKRKTIALLCALSILLTGCGIPTDTSVPPEQTAPDTESLGTPDTEGKPSGTEDSSTEKSNLPAASVGTPVVSFELISNEYQSDDKEISFLYTDYTRPSVTIPGNENATVAITDTLLEQEQSLNTASSEYLTDAKELYRDNPDIFSSYGLTYEYELKRCDSCVLSLRSYENIYLGGAHGYYTYRGWNFDTRTGKKLTLSDITDDKEKLLACAKEYILSQLELPYYSDQLIVDTENLPSIVEDSVLVDDMWYFTNSGLTFLANAELLGSYAAGAFFFTVPYQQLEALKPEYEYYGPLEVGALLGSTLSADLDGNEDMEAVFFNCTENEDTGELTCTLTINGTDFSDRLDSMLSYGAVYLPENRYYIVDLDTSDAFAEIAILDNGPSDDPVTHFFRYDKGNLSYLGCIYGLLDDSYTHNNGDGTIQGRLLISLLETARVPATYKLDNNEISLAEEDWYYVDESTFPQAYKTHEILKDVVVYKENNRNAETVTLTPQDGPVTFPATDNKHWFMIKTPDEQLYYLYLEDFSTLESGDWVTDVFDTLFQAG